MVLSAMSLMAADSKTIYVNTFDDEAGENSSKCSLREAIIAAQKNTSFGGCSAGRTGVGQVDEIQLEAGTYKLTRGELSPESPIRILGKSRNNYEIKSSFTNEYPEFEEIKTVIDAQDGSSRIFNTAVTRVNLELNNIALNNGSAKDYGGAVYAGGNFAMSNGAILNSSAAKAGGAIYLLALDAKTEVSINNTRIENNNALKGSVLAMSCVGNLSDNQPIVTISQSSIVKNGNQASLSTMDFCGSNEVTLEANTIAKNTASASNGSIIRAVSDGLDRLSPYSSLVFSSNTIVENSAYSAFYYDENASKSFSYNVLAYNGTADGQGKSCRYLNNQIPAEDLQFAFLSNAAELSNANCVIPAKAISSAETDYKNLDVSGIAMPALLTDYRPASVYNIYLPLYYPLEGNAGASLVNIGSSGCSEYDQRGVARNADATLILNPSMKNTCDIGSVEKLNFTAADVEDLTNSSQKAMITALQAAIDQLKADIADQDRKEYKTANEMDLKEAEPYLAQFKSSLIYRAIYMNPFALALPQEVDVGNTQERKYKALNSDNYDVIVQAIGIGNDLTVDSTGKPVIKGDALDLVCKWDANLKKIVIYRTGGAATGDQNAYCQYTLKEKTGSMQQSSGILTAKFNNIAPIAADDTYSITTDSNLTVRVNPLENDSEDGDGPVSSMPAGKSLWHQNLDGQNIPIYFKTIPAGLNFKAEYSGPCPDGNQQNMCYGGTIEFSSKNAFNQFNHNIVYQVYDSEGTASNEATITLINQAKNTNESSSGGGSINIFGGLVLAGLALFRMRKFLKS
ncbi:CSLREA domain-containing protein [Acinetobacter pragensis]